MKTVVIGPAHPLRGGIASTNEAFARALQKAGHDCTLISFYMQYPKFLFPGKTQFSSDPKPTDITIHHTISSVNPLSWWATARHIKKLNPDVIFIRYWLPFMGPTLGTIAKFLKKRCKIIGITDNVIPHEARPGDKQFTNYFINQCHGFVTLSKTVLTEIQEFTPKPAIYLPHPLNEQFGEAVSRKEAREKLNWDQDKKFVLFFGLVRAYKGLDLLLKAFGESMLKESDIELQIVGEFYDSPDAYTDLIQKHDLTGKVHIDNRFVPNEDVKLYFSAADLVAQTYHTVSQSGITQIAYQFNTPMLVTNVGGLSEFVPHEKVGFVVEKDPTEIATAIKRFFDENLAHKLKTGVQEEKEKYLWSTFVKNIEEFSDSL